MRHFDLARPAAAGALLALLPMTACRTASPATDPAPAPAPVPVAEAPRQVRTTPEAIEAARADSARLPWTAADVRFMTDMIHHHAQAIQMSRMAPTHGAGSQVQVLAARIINAQMDEIHNMQQWLADRRQPWPHVDPTGAVHAAGGHEGHHGTPMMAGMLTEEQMRQLDAARGAEFDRLFLTFMIQHHRGAVAMLRERLDAGAVQNETVFRLVGDINVDQTTEIARMEKMLAALK